MALIDCPNCGHKISSLARFCPKCPTSISTSKGTVPLLADSSDSGADTPIEAPTQHIVFHGNTACCEELLQHEFKPSLDEKVILEGRIFIVRGLFNILDGYAYLTSKRYTVCDASGVNIVFQTGINGIVSIEEARHLISKKLIITTAAGEEIKIKCHPHKEWLHALHEPKGFTNSLNKPNPEQSNENTGTLDWHYESSGIKIGPVKENIIVQLILNNHTIYRNTKVWNSCLPEWKRADETILTIYFNESSTSNVDSVRDTQGTHKPFLNFLSQFKRLYKRFL